MKIRKLTERVYYLPPDDYKDRPMLGYIRGDRHCLAVDAGFSPDHVDVFYKALDDAGLARPDMTVLTHWHWDHTMGISRIKGTLIACRETCRLMDQERERMADPAYEAQLRRGYTYLDDEFRGRKLTMPRSADREFEDRLDLDLGGVTAEASHIESPHTPDSVMIYVPEDRILFLGDASLGAFEDGGSYDPEKLKSMFKAVEGTGCRTVLLGHQGEMDAEDFLFNMRKLLGWLSTDGGSVTKYTDI